MDEKQKTVLLTEQGYEDAEEILNVKDLYDPREQWASYVLNAIKAKELFLRDVNYIIRGKEVLIVDEFTGRVMQVLFLNSSVPSKRYIYLIVPMVCLFTLSLRIFLTRNMYIHITKENNLRARDKSALPRRN